MLSLIAKTCFEREIYLNLARVNKIERVDHELKNKQFVHRKAMTCEQFSECATLLQYTIYVFCLRKKKKTSKNKSVHKQSN